MKMKMKMKRNLIHGALAGLLAGLVSIAYQMIYSANMLVDFSAIAMPLMILISTTLGTVIASLGYWLLKRLNWFGSKTDLLFSLLFFALSFVSIYSTFGAPLPKGTLHSELFAGLVIPMHFFPFMLWLLMKPVFEEKTAK